MALERGHLAAEVETVFLGGGTPTFTEPAALARLLSGLPAAAETTVEANPETVTRGLAALLREHGVDRISLGAQTFQPRLLATLERRARPEDVRGAVHILRDAGFDNVSLDLILRIPGQSAGDLERTSLRRSRWSRAPVLLRAGGEARNTLHARTATS